ncbi:MAG: DNA mismatch repair protein MutS [Myxococcales bacterium FL481]|nr:MAG: DNA mismatch repair protein MutS [Myxococcales bacterium FL481]
MPAPHNSADSPVMRQYLEIKARYPDSILMFRMGDFYEMFFDDAVTVGPILDIVVTTRDKNADDPVPMAGVPYHAIGGYLRTLVERGLKVAVCEQMESPEEAKRRKGPNIVRREVVRVVTPGALLDEEHLVGDEANYLVALCPEDAVPGPMAVAALDISSGEFSCAHCTNEGVLAAELARLAPREILVGDPHREYLSNLLAPHCPALEAAPQTEPRKDLADRIRFLHQEGGGTGPLPAHLLRAAAAAVGYAEATQPGQTLLLHRLVVHKPEGHVVLDEATLRNLEVYRTLREGRKAGTLLWAVDATQTTMGARLLRSWLGSPLRDRAAIVRRQDGIEALIAEPQIREELRSRLKDVRDVVRLAARARLRSIKPREMGALRNSLAALPTIAARLDELASRRTDRELPPVLELGDDLLDELSAELHRLLVDNPPTVARDGGMIRDGADPQFDEHAALRSGGQAALAAIELREREATQIPTLKVQHNRVFGYFLEVPKAHLSRVPDSYVRKQTLANAERYVTEELAELESKVLGAQAAALARELELFEGLRGRISEAGERLCELGHRLAQLDVLAGLAEVAAAQHYVRPEIVDAPVVEIVEGRHPVVERLQTSGQFVPNDVRLKARGGGSEPARLMLITGPNMGGKSTVMRQVALCTILAHMGSFIPAATATVGLVDRVFTRVGAADDLGRGESTFMVEMRETATILTQATPRSLVLLDEIGRGTATFDGLALAWAISEYLHDQVACRVMFATHYHELCGLEARLAGVRNVHVSVHEQRGRIVFLHRLEPGPAGRSYGISVGKLAGLPSGVLRRAGRILERLEAHDRGGGGPQLELFAPRTPDAREARKAEHQAAGVPPELLALAEELRELEPDDLSPRAAHDLLCTLKARVERLDA